MNAKDRAIELYNNFRNENSIMTANVRAKKQALICVDEIIKVLNQISIEESGTTKIDYGQNYWELVKNKIESL